MKKRSINYGRQSISGEDIQHVLSVLESDFLTQGPLIEAFEQALCDYTGARYCVVVSSGTAALHLAVKALDIEEGLQGMTSPISFVASANCMVYNRLMPGFADIDAKTVCLDPDALAEKVTQKTRLVIPVHFSGYPCDMAAIQKIGKKHGLYIIEDAAHAIGSTYPGSGRVGNCRYSDMTVFSFHPVKTITTGEGGAITTNSEKLYKKLKELANHGIVRDRSEFQKNVSGPVEPWYYEMKCLGYNYRMTDLQCALGISQLSRIDRFLKRRQEIAEIYHDRLHGLKSLRLPLSPPAGSSSYHIYVVQLVGRDRLAVFNRLKDLGIHANVHYIPIHLQPYYQKRFGYREGDFPVAEKYYQSALTLPLYPEMTPDDVDFVIDGITQVLD